MSANVTVELALGDKIVVTKTAEGKIKCPLCNEPFISVAYFKVHHSQKHTSKELICKFCGLQSFPNQTAFDDHNQSYHSEKDPLKCAKCGRISKDKKAFWRHIRESHRLRKFPCPECGFEFTRPENLKAHLEQKHSSKPLPTFECKECGRKFKVKGTLTQHILSNHREYSKRECPICGKEFSRERLLKMHVNNVHDKIRKFECTLCDVKFATSGHLSRHRKSLAHKMREESGEESVTSTMEKTIKVSNQSNNRGRKRKAMEEESSEESEPELHPPDQSNSVPEINSRPPRQCKTKAKEQILKTAEIQNDDVHTISKPQKLRKKQHETTITTPVEQSTEIIVVDSQLEPHPRQELDDTNSEPNTDNVTICTSTIKVEEPFLQIIQFQDDNWDNVPQITQVTSLSLDVKIKPEPPPTPPKSSPRKKYFCAYCDKGFKTLETCEAHEPDCGKYSKSKKTYKCPECGLERGSRRALNLHKVVHVDDRPFPCDLCPQPRPSFKRFSTLKQHQDTAHFGKMSPWEKYKLQDRSVECGVCRKVLASKKSLNRHMIELHPADGVFKPHQCKFCSMRFKRKRAMDDHIILDHGDEKKWECKICSTWYNRDWKLRMHNKKSKRHQRRVAALATKKRSQKRTVKTNKTKKFPGAHNILLRNVPESEEGLNMAKLAMQILLPSVRVNVYNLRVGTVRHGGKLRRLRSLRPLRVILPSVYYKNLAISNAKKLKDGENGMEKIVVTKDFRCREVPVKKNGLDFRVVRK